MWNPLQVQSGNSELSQRNDAARNLPAAPLSKVKALRIAAMAAHGSLRSLREQFDELHSMQQSEVDHLEQLTTPRNRRTKRGSEGMALDAGDPRVTVQRAKVNQTVTDMAALQTALENASAHWQNLSQTVSAIDDYLRAKLRGGAVKLASVAIEPALRKGESIVDAIEARRRRGRELLSDYRATRAAPITTDMAKKIARQQILGLIEAGRPDVMAVVDHGEQISWPAGRMHVMPDREPIVEKYDSLAIIAWLFRDQLIAAINVEVDQAGDDANALTAEARTIRLRQVLGDLLAVEREEEALITMAQAQGLTIARRSDADPRAVLSLSDDMPAPAIIE